ncbi:MAG TPA: glycosyltransferase family 4 protein [Thermoanaerobaculia bacterium]|nr:glycosyltransferase family 4 protein [Thermoanaerobaculia bacterium]
MKILLVVSRPPFPPRRGDQMRAAQTLEFLGAAHEVTLLAPRGGDALSALRPSIRLETYAPPNRFAKLLGVAHAFFSGQPLQSGLFRNGDLARKLRALAPRHDLVLLQLERLIGHLPDLGSTPLVVDLIDSLALNVSRRADFDSRLWRPALRFEAARLLQAERRLAERASKVLVVSERDRRYLEECLGPELAAKVTVVPLAMSIPEELPPTLKLWKKPGAAAAEEIDESSFSVAGDGDRPLLAITGNLGYFPTVDGALWFLRHVWPAVRAARPAIRLQFAGSRPGARLRSAIARAGAELIESPPDLRSILAQATLALAPMRSGSGLPVKVLEAWAAGVPVLTTPWTAAGVSGRAGEALAVVEPEPAAWCREIVRLLDDPAERRQLAENARKRLVTDYGAESVAARWRAAIG